MLPIARVINLSSWNSREGAREGKGGFCSNQFFFQILYFHFIYCLHLAIDFSIISLLFNKIKEVASECQSNTQMFSSSTSPLL